MANEALKYCIACSFCFILSFFLEISTSDPEVVDGDGQSTLFYGLQFFIQVGMIILAGFYGLILLLLFSFLTAFRNKFFIFNIVLQLISILTMVYLFASAYDA